MSLAELFGALGEEERDEPSLTDAQIATRLTEVFALRAERHSFKPGQVILHKYPSMANTKDAAKPAVFVRYLDDPFAGHELHGAGPDDVGGFRMALHQDCVVLSMSRGCAVEFLQDSADYKPHPDFTGKH